jgi:hypothetical protein
MHGIATSCSANPSRVINDITFRALSVLSHDSRAADRDVPIASATDPEHVGSPHIRRLDRIVGLGLLIAGLVK